MPAQQNDGRNAPFIHYNITRARIISTQENGQAQLAEARRAATYPRAFAPPYHSASGIEAENAVRCNAKRSALHEPSQRAATGNAPHCVGKARMHTLSLQSATPIPTTDYESPKSIPHQSPLLLLLLREKRSGRHQSKLEGAKKHTINTILSSKENHRSPLQAI